MNASQIWMNCAALSAESSSRIPPRCFGWFATMPTLRPPMRAKHVMILRAHRGLMSRYVAVVDDRADQLVHVVRLARGLGQQVEQRLVAAVDRVGDRHDRRRLLAVRREEREVLLHRARCTPRRRRPRRRRRRLRQCTFEPPSPAPSMSSPVTALTSGGPAERQRADALHHRHVVGEAGDVRRARRARADHRRDLRDDAAHDAPARGTGAPEPAKSESARRPPGCARRPSR